MAQTTKYHNVSVPEGIELLKGDIKDLATDYWESTQKEENQYFKYPPLPLSLLRYLKKPIKGLYEAEKKTGGLGISLFKTIAGDKSRREFLNTLILNSKKMKDIKFKQMIKETLANPKGLYKFPGKKEMAKFFKKLEETYITPLKKQKTNGKTKLKDWDTTGKTLHATGGRIDKPLPTRSRDI
tara:strand:- start:465 stop:1013 length:549 start_codon:yes stop_codon:yes gene_type:complete